MEWKDADTENFRTWLVEKGEKGIRESLLQLALARLDHGLTRVARSARPVLDGEQSAYPRTTRTWCSRPSSDRATGASTGSGVPSRLTLDTPRQTAFGFSTSIR